MAKVAELDLVGSVAGGLAPCIPPGNYLTSFQRMRTCMMFGRQPKVIMTFGVVDGEHMGTQLEKFYNAKQLIGKQGPRGQFKVGRSSDYLFDYVRLHGAPARLDRLPTSAWRNSVYTVKVRTVKTRRGGDALPDALHYSVIDKIISKDAGPP